MRAKIQALGGFLTAMVIPNMGAFIAWGIITALFIPTGWIPNDNLVKLVDPMIKYLLPLLIAYNGGKLVAGDRGGVAGTIGTMGLIVGAQIPMFLGAMIMGPFSAWVVKKFDDSVKDKIPTGFEMIVNNFALGIIGFILCLVAYLAVGPAIEYANQAVTNAINWLLNLGFLPLLSVINEPAKVLFLNNVIDQGIYYPLGMQATQEFGKSILFMVASNPGPGLGLLLAFSIFGKGTSKETAPGAIIIHFFGGIHEIYFPYVLARPLTILSMIAGGATGIFVFELTKVGLVAGPSPGSIFAYLALTPKGDHLGVILGVTASVVVSFLVTSFILKVTKTTDDDTFKKSQEASKAMKQEGKDILNNAISSETTKSTTTPITNIAFACDAGMGSSAMGASAFSKKLKNAGLDITVKNYAIEKVPAEAEVIVTHKNLEERTRKTWPDKRIVTIDNFLKDENIDNLFEEISNQ